jgi:hypothetical protein
MGQVGQPNFADQASVPCSRRVEYQLGGESGSPRCPLAWAGDALRTEVRNRHT